MGFDILALMQTRISRSWWGAARELVAKVHAAANGGSGFVGISSIQKEVSNLLANVKREADSFDAFAKTTYRGQTAGLDEVHCAVQWAQNSTTVFLGVKYAARWSAPGAIEVVDLAANVSASGFQLNGYGHHSSIRKRYMVDLDLFADVLPTPYSHWSTGSVGRMTATLHKAKKGKWPRLTKSQGKSKHPITSWLDMEERWSEEMKNAFNTSKPAEPKPKEEETKKKGEKKKKKGKEGKEVQKHPAWLKYVKKGLKHYKELPLWLRDGIDEIGHENTITIVILVFFGLIYRCYQRRCRRPSKDSPTPETVGDVGPGDSCSPEKEEQEHPSGTTNDKSKEVADPADGDGKKES